MGKCTERLYNGIVKENPTFVQMLGMCPTLAVTSSAVNGAGMGLTTTCILVLSNFMISALRKVIPDKVRIPSFIVIIASFVTVIQFLLEAYLPSLNSSLGLYIPLIVVNCIILGRAEAYASKNPVLPSVFDGLGMGLGFTVGLTVIGMFRELLGKGCIFGYQILGDGNLLQNSSGPVKWLGEVLSLYTPVTILVLAPGAFFVLAFIIAFINRRNAKKAAEALANGEEIPETCRPDTCAGCVNAACCGSSHVVQTAKSDSVNVKAAEAVKTEKPEVKTVGETSGAAKTEKSDTANSKAAEAAKTEKPDENTGYSPTKEEAKSELKFASKEQTDKIKSKLEQQSNDEPQAEKPVTSQPEEEKPQVALQPDEEEKPQIAPQPEADIKLKETMANIRKKKGKGGKR